MLKDYLSHDLVYQRNADWTDGRYNFERDWRWFIDNSNLKNKISMLELGCGASPYLHNFSQFIDNYLGLDISPSAIKTAKERNGNDPNNKFICSNFIEEWKVDRTFDLIVDSFFLHCIIGDDRKIAIEKIEKSLSSNGEFWINTMCNPPKMDDMLQSYNSKTKCMEIKRDSDVISVRQFDTPEDIRNLLASFGLKLIKEEVLSDEYQDNYLAIFKKEEN
jgi:SAM-dependent methyltransferase